jgi:pimeloyl-ACP methyl ester carboxylesterase
VAALSEVICTGDCNYDHTAAISELVSGVMIALDRASIDTCRGIDLDGDDRATVDELIGGVRNALDGCPRARLERASCDFTLPAGRDPASVDCGSVIVQEDRSLNDGRTVRLPVVVCRAPGSRRDPIVGLSGGPGGAGLPVGSSPCDDPATNSFQARFDIVYFDQRGTGRSLPSLDCPEWREAFSSYLAVEQGVDEDVAALQTALRACHDRLMSAGVNFGAYTSSASAHDVQDLMLALGYDDWKLYGNSYGTRVAMTALRDTPSTSAAPCSTRPCRCRRVGKRTGPWTSSARSTRSSLAAPPTLPAMPRSRTSSRPCSISWRS